ncbi:hypothetical protein C7450_101870 [Chelatococcus asaccharovorans]|uniref:Uncharacterized protein n=1 Tax=Chelatococcus asaccharovorans TaxID=28210 RepID=A0A2V3UJU1_9HYPH|nr:hypothetical protein C7450_101870 [Chelatococcus asaccharovorans]
MANTALKHADYMAADMGHLAAEEARLLALEAEYCSHGDTVHYT